MPEDNRARILMPVEEFERSIHDLDPTESREAKIAHVREGIRSYWAEVNWKSDCRPSYWLQCMFPPLWPILWYRGVLSKSAQRAFGIAVHRCRRRWARELHDVDLSFEGIPDPPERP
jgi:hypothetical protein